MIGYLRREWTWAHRYVRGVACAASRRCERVVTELRNIYRSGATKGVYMYGQTAQEGAYTGGVALQKGKGGLWPALGEGGLGSKALLGAGSKGGLGSTKGSPR